MERVGRYRILSEIARGGMGIVYRARDDARGRDVAVKLLMAGRGATDRQRLRFLREARALSKLSHPNVVPVLEHGEHDGFPFMVMELVEGPSLEDRLRTQGPLESLVAAELTLALARALEHIHQKSILHRDVKPDNVILHQDGRPMLADFGLVKDIDSTGVQLSQTGEIIGSPGYWSPEQATGERELIGPRSDVYSLGATLYTALTGTQPFQAANLVEAVVAACNVAPEPPSLRQPGVAPALESICLKCMAKAPEDRYPTAAALAAELEQFIDDVALDARVPRRRRLLGPLTVVTALGAVAVGVSQLAQRRASDDLSAVEATQAKPTRAYWLQRGHFHRSTGALEEALRDYERAQEYAPEDANLASLRARVLSRLGRVDEAIRAATEALALDPQQPSAYSNRGLAHSARGDDAAACEDFSRALALDPDDVNALEGRSRSNLRLGRFTEAIADASRAIERSPGRPGAHNNRGAARFELGDLREAARDFLRAAELKPAWALAHRNAAVALHRLGALERARAEYLRVVDLDPKHVQAWNGLGECDQSLGDFAGAIEAYDRATSLGGQNATIYFNRGLSKQELGRYEDALYDYDQALLLGAKGGRTQVKRGQVLSLLERTVEALAAFREATKLDPANSAAWFRLGLLLAETGDTTQALLHYSRAVELDPSFVQALANRATLRLQRGEYELAEEDLDRVLELTPESGAAQAYLLARANARIGRGELTGARSDLDAFLRHAPDGIRALILRGRVCLLLGVSEEAVVDLERALDLLPEADARRVRVVHLLARASEASE